MARVIGVIGFECFIFKSRHRRSFGLKDLKFSKRDNYGANLDLNYGRAQDIEDFLGHAFSSAQYEICRRFFLGVSKLEKKLRIAYASSSPYHDLGAIYYFVNINYEKPRSVCVIHCSLKSMIFGSCGHASRSKYLHIYNPADDFISVLTAFFLGIPHMIKKIFLSYVITGISLAPEHTDQERKIEPSSLPDKNNEKIALFFHKSASYGKHYLKNHYFSSNQSSPLSLNKVHLYIIEPYPDEDLHINGKKIETISQEYRLRDLIDLFCFVYFIFLAWATKRGKIRFWPIVFLAKFYLDYLSWRRNFCNKEFSLVIYDYDVLFPKPLSLAYESLGVKTLAIQERPSMTFQSYIYGVFCYYYLFAGKMYFDYSREERSVVCEVGHNFGMWRTSYFYDDDLIVFDDVKILTNCGKKRPGADKKMIVILGYFILNDYQTPLINHSSLECFFGYVENILVHFKDCEVLLRMKALGPGDADLIMSRFASYVNFFLVDDYEYEAVSYRLCASADVIVALPTSLAEESIAAGKKVVFIDDIFTVSNLFSSIYPEDFHFAIARSPEEVIYKTQECLDGVPLITQQFSELREKISGDGVFIKKSDISDAIRHVTSSHLRYE